MKTIPPQTIAARVFHWINLVSLSVMLLSGLQIYNANPVFGGRAGVHLPPIFLLGGWLAGGRDWHFAAMNLFAVNLFAYGCYVLLSRRWKTRFVGTMDAKAIALSHNPQRKAYAFHRLVYSAIVPVLLLAILSGVGMYKPAQFDWILKCFGDDWQMLRVVHFMTVPIVLLFTIVHVSLVWRVGARKLVASMFW
jgi:thiosulfate reductase cytochrome b subunit